MPTAPVVVSPPTLHSASNCPLGVAVRSLRGTGRPAEHQQQLNELLADPCDGRDQEIVLGNHSGAARHTHADAEVIGVEDRRKQRGEQRVDHPRDSMHPVGIEVHIAPHTGR